MLVAPVEVAQVDGAVEGPRYRVIAHFPFLHGLARPFGSYAQVELSLAFLHFGDDAAHDRRSVGPVLRGCIRTCAAALPAARRRIPSLSSHVRCGRGSCNRSRPRGSRRCSCAAPRVSRISAPVRLRCRPPSRGRALSWRRIQVSWSSDVYVFEFGLAAQVPAGEELAVEGVVAPCRTP